MILLLFFDFEKCMFDYCSCFDKIDKEYEMEYHYGNSVADPKILKRGRCSREGNPPLKINKQSRSFGV
jgi:hypothetical protein